MNFLSFLNSLHIGITFTMEVDMQGNLPFLDVLVYEIKMALKDTMCTGGPPTHRTVLALLQFPSLSAKEFGVIHFDPPG